MYSSSSCCGLGRVSLHRAQLSAYFGEIYSLPNHPALEGVRKVFSEATVVSLSANTLAEKVGRILKGVANEQPAVRLDALEHLAKVLKENSKVLSELVTGHDSVAPMISELFTVVSTVASLGVPDWL